MPLIETLTVGVGSAVAKAVLRIWLRGEPAETASGELVDIIKEHVPEFRDQRRAKALLNRVADEVADKLEPFYNTEFARLPENEREAAAHAVALTIDRGALSLRAVVERSVDPRALEGRLRDETPSAASDKHLSTDAEQLYDITLREVCNYIAEIATSLPAFGTAALLEMLRRGDELNALVHEILEKLPEPAHAPHGPLPRVGDIDPYDRLGLPVPPDALAAVSGERTTACFPYAQRDVDRELRAALLAERFVVLVGDSKAGKTRTAWEAALAQWPDRRMLIPPRDDPIALAQLLKPDGAVLGEAPTLVWLDDLERYLTPGGLTTRVLDGLEDGDEDVLLLATITRRVFAAIHGGQLRKRQDAVIDEVLESLDERRCLGREVLRRFTPIWIELRPTSAERTAFQIRYPGQRLVGGLGEHFVAATELVRRFQNGDQRCRHDPPGTTCPVGQALVHAAIDWRRAGLVRPVPEAELKQLYPAYLPSDVQLSDEHYEEALGWATSPIASHVALLNRVEVGARAEDVAARPAFEPFDYLVEQVAAAADSRPVPASTWERVLAASSPEELPQVGLAISGSEGSAVPRRAWAERAAASAHPAVAAVAALARGDHLAEQDDLDGARKAYEQANASDIPAVALLGLRGLGALLEKQGDVDGAQAIYERVVASNDPVAAPMALGILGALHDKRGDPDRARQAYERAIASGHPAVAPMAMVSLAHLHEDSGELDAAKRAYERAIASGDADMAPKATRELGDLLAGRGDVDGARKAYEETVASGHVDEAPKAMITLGVLLQKQGDVEKAQDAFEEAIASGHTSYAPMGMVCLGMLFAEHGDLARAREAYEQAIRSGDPDATRLAVGGLATLSATRDDPARPHATVEDAIDSSDANAAPMTLVGVGALRYQQGDMAAARDAFEDAIASRHPEAAPLAALGLGVLLAEQGDVAGARRAYEKAIDSGHSDAAPRAIVSFAQLLEEQHDLPGARDAYEQAIATGHADIGPKAIQELGDLLVKHGDFGEARNAYQQAVASGHPETAPMAALALGALLAEQLGDVPGAQRAYERAIVSGHADLGPVAMVSLGILLAREGNVAGAREAFEQAIRSEHADMAPAAMVSLGELLGQHDLPGARGAFEQAIATEHPDEAPAGMFNLAVLLANQGEVPEARDLLKQTIATGHPFVAERAREILAKLPPQ